MPGHGLSLGPGHGLSLGPGHGLSSNGDEVGTFPAGGGGATGDEPHGVPGIGPPDYVTSTHT